MMPPNDGLGAPGMAPRACNELQRGLELDALSSAERAMFVLCCFLTVVPMLVVTFPPTVDTAQHAAQIDMLMRFDDPTCRFDEHVEANWFTPYLFGYMIAFALAHLMPVAAAVKLTIAMAIVAIPLTFAVFLRAARKPMIWSFLGFPVAFSFAAHWGFLSLTVGLPIGFLFLAATVRYAERPTWHTAAGMGLFLLFVFFCHALLAMFCGGIGLLLLLRQRPSWIDAARWGAPLVATAPIALLWLRTTQADHAETRGIVWGSEVNRVPEILSRLVGEPAILLAMIFAAAMVAYLLLTGGKTSRRVVDWLPVYAAAIWFFAAPQDLFGGTLLYARFHVFSIGLLILAIEVPDVQRLRWRAVPIGLALFWLGLTIMRWSQFETESADFRRLLATMEPEHRAFSLILDRDSEHEAFPVYQHFPVWYQVVADGCFTEPSFAFSYPIVLRYPVGGGPGLPLGIEVSPEVLEVGQYLDRRWHYIVARDFDDPRLGVLQGLPLEAIAREGSWWLFIWDDPPTPS